MGKTFGDIKNEILAQLDSATSGTWGSNEVETGWNRAQKKIAQDLPDFLLGASLMGSETYSVPATDPPSEPKIHTCNRPPADLRVVSLEHVVHATGAHKSVKLVPTYGDVLAQREVSGSKWVSGRATTLGALEGGTIRIGPIGAEDTIFEIFVKQPTDLDDDGEETELPDDLVPVAEDYACYLLLLQTKGENARIAQAYLATYRNGIVDLYTKAHLEPPRAYIDRPEVK